jgi:hypothetical protein
MKRRSSNEREGVALYATLSTRTLSCLLIRSEGGLFLSGLIPKNSYV